MIVTKNAGISLPVKAVYPLFGRVLWGLIRYCPPAYVNPKFTSMEDYMKKFFKKLWKEVWPMVREIIVGTAVAVLSALFIAAYVGGQHAEET